MRPRIKFQGKLPIGKRSVQKVVPSIKYKPHRKKDIEPEVKVDTVSEIEAKRLSMEVKSIFNSFKGGVRV